MKGQQLILLLLIICLSTIVHGQLYYFSNADKTLIGIRNAQGDTIIAPVFPRYGGGHELDSITGPTIEFNLLPAGMKYDLSKPASPLGAVYDRNGRFLYYPQGYDNGPDHWEEGLRRYAEDGKIGFADRLGNKVMPPNWEFALPFNYGYAKVYEGELKKVYDRSGEHWAIAPKRERDTLSAYLIDRNGHRVIPLPCQQHEKDYLFEGKYYPYPFHYSDDEQTIVDSINNIKAISVIYSISIYPYDEKRSLQFEIVERPNPYSSYYVLAGYENQQSIVSFQISHIFVHQHTGEMYIGHRGKKTLRQ